MQVSFIAALHNHLPLTQAMVRSLRETWPEQVSAEVVLVDDGSTDGTREWLSQLNASDHQVILRDENSGFAAANNCGARRARGEILIFLNNDLVLLPGWLGPLLKGVQGLPQAGMVGNIQRRHANRSIDHCGVSFDLLRRPYHVRIRRPWQAWRAYSRFPAVTAACCAVRRDLFLAHGGFDEAYHNGYEDIDLCLRLRQAGRVHYVANRSQVLHHVSASTGRFQREDANLRLFLDRWGWPASAPSYRRRGINYVGRHWFRPWRYNGPKLLLALGWLLTGRACPTLERRLGVTIKYKP